MRLRRTLRVPERLPTGSSLVEARGITVEFGAHRVLDDVALSAHAGEVVALVGPNGAGKSTLLGVLSGDIEPSAGRVAVHGRPLGEWTTAELALRRAVLPQQVTVAFPFTVRDVVAMGRAPWATTPFEREDDEAIERALVDADVAHLAARPFPSLSGGERARVALARIFAQRTQLLFLDEPTAALDVHHQERVCAYARERAAAGDGVVLVVHDLGVAAAYAHRVVVVARGHVVADGSPATVCTPELLSDVYQHDIDVLTHPETGTPVVVPRRPRSAVFVRSEHHA